MPGQWSRSRFWLCHFLHSRHEREPVPWDRGLTVNPALAAELLKWLKRRRTADTRIAWFLGLAVREDADDPAYIQALRLMFKERQHHDGLYGRLEAHLGAVAGSTVSQMGRPGGGRIRDFIRACLGPRFALSLLVLDHLMELAVLRICEQFSADPALRGVAAGVGSELNAHIALSSERLTWLYADFNFIRRNLRRLRLRLMCAAMLIMTRWRYRRLIRTALPSTWPFLTDTFRRFNRLLEQIVPYHRHTLRAVLLRQRQHPYDPHQFVP